MVDGCGISCWHPKWMRRFENTRWFLIIYGLLGTIQATAFLYFVVTLTTIERRFKIPSQTTGILLSGNEISQILLSLTLTYYGGQSNRPRWIAWGVVFAGLSCFILAWPHFLYGAGDEAIQLTKEYFSDHQNLSSLLSKEVPKKNSKLCHSFVQTPDECDEVFSYLPLILIFLSQFVLGIGNTLYYSLGQSYLDDNTHHRKTPLMLAYAFSMRMFGPVLGFVLAYFTMSLYIDPSLTPVIMKDDPRWLGAWWLGWIILGSLMLIFAAFIGMFPKDLPTQQKKVESDNEKCESKTEPIVLENNAGGGDTELKNFPKALMRLLTNKLLMYNNVSTIFYILGGSGFITYMSRLMEVQFNRSSAGGSMLTGPITLSGMVLGLLTSGIVITKYQPSPKYLFFWNVIVGVISTFAALSYSHLGCQSENSLLLNGTVASLEPCNSNCFCSGITYSPVCDKMTGETFFSPCHAGCKRFDEKRNVYTDCVCSASTVERLIETTTMSIDLSNTHVWNDAIVNNKSSIDKILESNETDHRVTLYEIYDEELKLNKNAHDHDETIDANDLYEYDDDSEENASDNSEERLLSQPDDEDDVTDTQPTRETNIRRRDVPVERLVTPGVCAANCDFAYYTFTLITSCSSFISSTGRIGNVLLNFRAVEPRDKSFSQGLSLFMVSLLALIPGPIIYGRIIDSTCLIWSYKCGERGNCSLYDPELFRYYLHTMSAFFTILGVVFDVLVWHFGKNLNLYDDPSAEKETKTENSPESEPLNK